ncbi:hypothetical protein J5X84_12025 [Streptosporangiaceae bacterium NEAU-GS5]|nr:hypothetical protein [Streptosporangiaceae bacterium NEAU-GS5]
MDGTSPYVGLRPYNLQDRALFCGRERESREIATLWQATGLTVLYGASGVGKTSILQAGVIPQLDPERVDTLPVARIKLQPNSALTEGNKYIAAILSSWTDQPIAGQTMSHFLAARPRRLDRYGDPMPILLAIDQAEELFQESPSYDRERLELLEDLKTTAQENFDVHLLLCLREEYLFMVLPFESRMGRGTRARFHLPPLSKDAAREAVQDPLSHTTIGISPAALELMVDKLGTIAISGDADDPTRAVDVVEPVQLQVVCSALWSGLEPDTREITEEHVRVLVDVEEFLLDFYTRAVQEVADQFDISATRIGFWIRNTFVTEHGTRNIIYQGLEQTQGMPNAVVSALEDRYILRAEHRLGILWYELAHDRLIIPVSHVEPPENYLRAARTAVAAHNWETAKRLADLAVRTSDYTSSWVRAEAAEILATVASANGDVHTARRHCEEAAQIFSQWNRFDGVARALVSDARLWLAEGDYATSMQRIQAALLRSPNDMSAHVILAEALHMSGASAAAAAHIRGVLPQLPTELLARARELLLEFG